MGRLTFNGDRLVYSAKRYNIVNTTQYLFSSMKNIADYVIENEAISGNFDKVIFVLRHSIRPRNNWANEVRLTPLGVNAARIAGQSLQTLPGNQDVTDYYSTKVTRTDQTAFYIAEGRNDEKIKTFDDIKNIYSIATDLNYINDTAAYNDYVDLKGYNPTWYEYMYDGIGTGTAFKDIKTVSDNFLESVVNNTITKNNIVISHDQNVMPLLVYSVNKLVDFRINECWLNYLSGIVILVKNGIKSIIPVSGLPSGYN